MAALDVSRARPGRQDDRVVAVLLTGMSGAGKSTALRELALLGYVTVDTDDAGWKDIVDGEPLWREAEVLALLDRPRDVPLFVSGTVANQGQFTTCFDAVVLMTAPAEVLLERVRARTTNNFGKTADGRAMVARDIVEVEPLLRAAATHVVDTRAPLPEVIVALVEIAYRGASAPGRAPRTEGVRRVD